MTGANAGRSRLEVRAGVHSGQGARPENEDFAAVHLGTAGDQARFGVVAAVADGVSGAKGGRVAAELAVRGFIDAHLGQSETLGVRDTSARGIEAINRWIHAVGRTDGALAGMACTLTALVLRGRHAHVVHVGDTRLYRFRDDRLDRLTADHVSDRAGMGNALTRALGAADGVLVDYRVEPLRLHDRFLLCSDGVHRVLSGARLRDALARRDAPAETARRLVEAARAGAGGDDATAVVLDVADLPAADQLDLELAIAALPIPPAPASGAVVDGFALGPMLSDGRYSRVFRGRDAASDRPVVLKFPKPVEGGDALLRQAFLREGWIAARVRSPWVGEVLEPPGERRTRLYTAMPFYAGETLEQRLQRPPPLPLAAGLEAALRLAKGVAALHRAGIVHRDIKPENVILEAGGGRGASGLRLVDLGVARLPNMEDFPARSTPGTPSYMAPELLAGAPGDERSDLFALGVTVYRAFTGAYPYGEVEPFSRPRFGAPVPLLQRRPDLPAWLDAALARALAARPEDRYADVLEFIFELEHGATRAAPVLRRRRPLHARDPLRFWQAVSAVLAALLLAGAALLGTPR